MIKSSPKESIRIERITERLRLVPATAELLQAELTNAIKLANLLDCSIPKDWPPGEYDRQAQEFFFDRMNEGGEDVIGWHGWYAIERTKSLLIAAGGFLGPPDASGKVEIGYSVVSSNQGLGYAKEMVRELVMFAFEDSRVLRIVAHTTKDNTASWKVLISAGFTESGFQTASGQIEYELTRGCAPA